jgi:tetratricopeptide (TPR) repeat protein
VDCPIHDCVVRVHVAVFVGEGEQRRCLSDSRPGEALQFELGTGCQPPGLEACLRLMVPGERALVQADARHAYQAALSGRWSAPAGLPPGPHPRLEWELELVGFDAPLNWHAATAEEALEAAERSMAAGLALFADVAWELARLRFLAVASKLAGLRGLEEPSEQSCERLRTACLLNAAACCQRLGEHAQAVQHCSTVLERMDGGNTKALYRRAVSRTELGLWEEARGDLEAARAADVSVAADCERQLARLARAERDAGKEARAALGGFLK